MTTRRRNIRTQLEQELEEEQAASSAAPGSPRELQATIATLPVSAPIPESLPQEKSGAVGAADPTRQVKARRVEEEEGAEDAEPSFEDTYRRETYYIRRAYRPRLKRLLRATRKQKYALMEEGLEYLFEKYGIE